MSNSIADFKLRIMAKRPITPEKAVELLKKHGTIVTIDEARKILDFMNKMAKINIEMLLNENKKKKRI